MQSSSINESRSFRRAERGERRELPSPVPFAPKFDARSRFGPLHHVVLDISSDAPPVAEQLKIALAEQRAKVVDLFTAMDYNSDGLIARHEFHSAMRTLGLTVSSDCIDDLFNSWDKDGSGSLTLKEVSAVLYFATNTASLRKQLANNAERVTDIFRRWDTDGNGQIELSEFREAMSGLMPDLGLTPTSEQVDQLFDSFDIDGGGTISFRELNKALRRDLKIERIRKAQHAALIEEAEHDHVEVVDLVELKSRIVRELPEIVDRAQKADDVVAGRNSHASHSARAS